MKRARQSNVKRVALSQDGIGAAFGTAFGALIGASIKTDRWEPIPLDHVRLSLAPQQEMALALV